MPLPTNKPRRPHSLTHLTGRIFGRPLAILPAKMSAILAGIGPRLLGQAPLTPWDDEIDDDDEDQAPEIRDGIATIQVHGTLVRRSTGMDVMSGMTSYESLTNQIRKAADDPEVDGILFDVDSPGGETDGLLELGDLIYSLRGSKPMLAACDSYMCSAAYLLGSAASPIFITQLGVIGSVGCFMLFLDESGADAKAGLKYTYIYSGAAKVDGNPHEPLNARARGEMQAETDRIRDLLAQAVARNRGVSVSSVLETEAAVRYGPAGMPLFADQLGGCDDAYACLAAMLPAAPTISLSGPTVPLGLPAPGACSSNITVYTSPMKNDSRNTRVVSVRSNLLPSAALAGIADRMRAELPGIEGRVIRFPGSFASAPAVAGSRQVTLFAIPYGSMSIDLGGMREIYGPRCFASGISGDIRILNGHDDDEVLGRVSAGTATVSEDAAGVHAVCDVSPTSYGDDVLTSLRIGNVSGSSAAFWILKSHFELINGIQCRVVDRAQLRDISVVGHPAYPDAVAELEQEDDTDDLAAARARLTRLRLAGDGRPAGLSDVAWARVRLEQLR